jgi:pimeloyl-ACP methyl ester carboxylesterase
MKTNNTTTDCEIPYTEVSLPLWRELFWGLEWLQLRSSPVYRGVGVARGQGQPVVLVPGFLSTDTHLAELKHWLRRIGYTVHASGIDGRAECPDDLLEKLLQSTKSVFDDSSQPVRMIGHSLGGTLARAVAVRRPDLVSQVITLGSPIREVRAHPLVVGIARLADRFVRREHTRGDHLHDGGCACALIEVLAEPFPPFVPRVALFTRKDGVLAWRSTMDEDPRLNIEVDASHLGLPFNAEVYRVLARLLAATDTRTVALAA